MGTSISFGWTWRLGPPTINQAKFFYSLAGGLDASNYIFFVRITQDYNKICSVQRPKDQLYSKWKDMNSKVKKFAGIFNQEQSHRRSGFSEDDYKRRAHDRYRLEQNGNGFTSEAAWLVLRSHLTWNELNDFHHAIALKPRPSKRSKSTSDHNTTDSDARCQFGLNEFTTDNDENDVRIEEPQRPIGRDKAKAKRSGSTSSSSLALQSYLDRMQLENDKFLSSKDNIAKKMDAKLEIMKQSEERKKADQKRKDVEFLIKPYDHLERVDLLAVLEMKEEIRKKIQLVVYVFF